MILFSKNSFIVAPSALQSHVDGHGLDSSQFCPLSERLGFIVESDLSTIKNLARIVCLNFSTSPSTILRRVRAIIINTVNGQTFRSLSHVLKKSLKGFLPSVTDSDSTSSVVGKVRTFGVVTPLKNAAPSVVFRGTVLPVGGVSESNLFSVVAPTTYGFPVSQAFSTDYFFGTTVALTKPRGLCSVSFFNRDHGQSSKLFPCEIDKSRHVPTIPFFSDYTRNNQ